MTALTGWANDDAVIAAAMELAGTLGEDPNHTVAAAAMDLRGTIYAGVNNYHFNGGPCAELVVLGMAASAHAGRLATIVAVGDGGRGVVSPCGRCRQVLLDQHPDIRVLVPDGDAIRSVSVRHLLPYSYVQPDGDPRRFVRFNRRYRDDVLSGRKTRTLRYQDLVPLGETTFVFEDSEHRGFEAMQGVIDSVSQIRLSELDAGYQRSLRSHYPEMPADALLDDVRFHV
ncbi:hypothetical protein [uncultured Tessaracoccus sp.]|uniref:hypothetical protein n=1 Tax=uncultured Tessaracoccus sp. TaxID=905023 RepID=UPI00260A8E03|nr:hypothetical protein [uncultured Tessaracoccus sp.]